MAAKGVLLAALAAVVLPLALRTPLRGGWERRDLNDFTLNLRHSRTVAETHRYPYAFLYPPPAVVLRLGLGALGFEIGGALWIAGMAAGALAAGWILASLLEPEIGPGRAALAVLLGWLAAKYAFEFDFKYLNGNVFAVVAALLAIQANARGRPGLAGVTLAIGIAYKIFPAVLVPFWWFAGRRRAAIVATIATVALFVVPSIAAFGLGGSIETFRSWLEALAAVHAPDYVSRVEAYLVSIAQALGVLFPSAGAERIAAVARGFECVIALAALALATLLGFRFRRIGGDGLCESALLLLPMVFASPQLQPHQLVLAWPATVCLAAILLAPGQCQPVSRRLVAATALGVGFALLEFGPARPWRGVVVLSALAIWALALAWLTLLTPPTDRVRDAQGRSPD